MSSSTSVTVHEMGAVQMMWNRPQAWSMRYVSTLMRFTMRPLPQPMPSPETPALPSGGRERLLVVLLFGLAVGAACCSFSEVEAEAEAVAAASALPPALARPEMDMLFS